MQFQISLRLNLNLDGAESGEWVSRSSAELSGEMGRWQHLLLRARSNGGPERETQAPERSTQSETTTFIATMLYRQARRGTIDSAYSTGATGHGSHGRQPRVRADYKRERLRLEQSARTILLRGAARKDDSSPPEGAPVACVTALHICTFASILNLASFHPFLLSPPITDDFPSPLGWLFDVLDGCLPCCRPASYFAPAAWPLSRHGALRFLWLTAQSAGLYLLASVNYTNEDFLFESDGESRKRAIQHGLHNLGAALAFILSFVAEALVLSTTPRGKHVGRKVCLSLGILCAVDFLITQEGFGCTGRVPATICPVPFGTASYMFECGMALSLAAIFFFTAFEQKEITAHTPEGAFFVPIFMNFKSWNADPTDDNDTVAPGRVMV
ncbi:hypothetical protein T492DRAFT_839133 [Pavlovales sp. CCMP2436]|nr:hypothetical protein T492DRAFT_839133 [Pavlovales sp. CCMP2436]